MTNKEVIGLFVYQSLFYSVDHVPGLYSAMHRDRESKVVVLMAYKPA